LSGLDGAQNLGYDIILHGRDNEEHDKRRRSNTKAQKCQFRLNSIKFLGFIVSDEGILKFTRPENALHCRGFMGLVNFAG